MSVCSLQSERSVGAPAATRSAPVDAVDRRIIEATQGGLPVCREPYRRVAETLGLEVAEVMQRMERMLAVGVIRRIAAVPNHYQLGYRANGMSVWDVCDDRVAELGRRVGALPFVSHCYLRPRRPPVWRYNLFAMVHGRSRDEVLAQVAHIADELDGACLDYDVLFSTRILKKTGLRIAPTALAETSYGGR